MALSAVDAALWDLKARILDIPLCRLIGMVRDHALVYGSGGFTSYSYPQLAAQLGSWADQGFRYVKMKVGRQPGNDLRRVEKARKAIGPDVRLFVDANGAYSAKQSLQLAEHFCHMGVAWFEEPVSSDDLNGLKFVREHIPSSIMIAAGEYGYTQEYFLRMVQAQAVDILQADATRCGGITGILQAGLLSDAFHIPFSFHCAPGLHLHPALCIPSFFIGEYFHDHVRIEQMLFEGIPRVIDGTLSPDLSSPGMGLELKHQDAARFRIF
jgi:L-alanine-DL-glutamate epimerase-like enolase superfamily enzyme